MQPGFELSDCHRLINEKYRFQIPAFNPKSITSIQYCFNLFKKIILSIKQRKKVAFSFIQQLLRRKATTVSNFWCGTSI